MSVATILLPTGGRVCTGRVKPLTRPRTLHLADFVSDNAADYPTVVDYATPVPTVIRQMYLNDRRGDCVIADLGKAVGVWAGVESGTPVIASDAEIATIYQRLKAGPGDSGCVITNVLDAWTAGGLTLGGKPHQIDGYAASNWRSEGIIRGSLYLFGGVRLGLDLPEDWANTPDGGTWGPTRSRIVGGHDVRIVKCDAGGVWVATWGGLRYMPWDVLMNSGHVDEAYAELSPDWYAKAATAPNLVDADGLKKALQLVGGGSLPPIVAPPEDEWSTWN